MNARTVLVVDDDAHLRASLTRTLRREPYRLITVADTLDALIILRACPVDVIVCDEAMPGMLGTEFLASIRGEYSDIVPILFTGYGSIEVAQRAVNDGGAFRLLSKPCDTGVLMLAIRDALRHRSTIERAHWPAEPPEGSLAFASVADEVMYGASTVFEVEDVPVDLQQLLVEAEGQRQGE